MQSGFRKAFFVALGAVLLVGPSAKAEQVQFITVGTFTGGALSGSSTYSDPLNGVLINFIGSLNNTATVPPSSVATFGQFDTTGTLATTLQPVSADFRLDIFQTLPTAGQTSFVGALTGSIRFDNSQAYVQFNGPLSATIGNVVYTITSADQNSPGRVVLSPPTINNGLSTIAGQVGLASVPEPSTVALLGLGAPLGLMLLYRRRRDVASAA